VRRGDKVAALLFGLALLAPFLVVVVLGDGQPHHLDLRSDVILGWLVFVAIAMGVFYVHTLAEEEAARNR
jgi:hypothetical protein